ncbi:hypothetical protein BBTM_00128 [Bifidobacterium bifidum]|nr:hypothetical protein BBTM_00128 [Bifidobacterium bifidum]
MIVSLGAIIAFSGRFQSFGRSVFRLSAQSSSEPHRQTDGLNSSVTASSTRSPMGLMPSP